MYVCMQTHAHVCTAREPNVSEAAAAAYGGSGHRRSGATRGATRVGFSIRVRVRRWVGARVGSGRMGCRVGAEGHVCSFEALAVIMARVEIDEAVQCLLPKLTSVFLSVLDPSRRSGVCPLRICASLGLLVAVFDAALRAVLAARQTRKRRGNTAWRQTSSHSNLQPALMTSAAQLGTCCNAPGLVREQGGWRKRQHCS